MIAQSFRQELLRLCQTSLDRPPGQRAVALVVSVWSLSWIVDRLVSTSAATALQVLAELLSRIGISGDAWVDALSTAWGAGAAGLPLLAGLLWAATTEGRQLPALLGWIAVMLGAERVGYQPAFLLALGTLIGFVGLLWLLALGGSGFVDRRAKLVASDVLRAGVAGAALSAMVPLLVPLQLGAWLARAYLTSPPRPLTPNRGEPLERTERSRWTAVRPVDHEDEAGAPGR